MEDEEDVTTNPVFVTLKQKYPSLYQLVQMKSYIVCVPQTASIAETISEEFLKSPYFQGTYLTLCDKSVEIENNEITTTQGFEEQRKIKVLSEELFYNAQSQGFRVLLIERHFTGGATVSPNNDQSPLPKERSATTYVTVSQAWEEKADWTMMGCVRVEYLKLSAWACFDPTG